MPPYPSISVVLPTYNCRPLLVRHLPAMREWLDLVHEIVVVDSRSTDGTLELIRAEIRHPRLRIIERDRGLYASWNEAIAATTGAWVYISTAGDTIARAQLLHLLEVGESLAADVVVSPPAFVHEDGRPHRDLGWPPAKLLQEFGRGQPFVMHPEATQYLAFLHCPSALLGSSASNLYRGPHLRARPFPTEYGTVGDTAWIMRFSHETRLALTPRRGSSFCIHEKESQPGPEQSLELYRRLLKGEQERLAAQGLRLTPMMAAHFGAPSLADRVQELRAEKRLLWRAPNNRLSNKLRWVATTCRYLWWRAEAGRNRRDALAQLRFEAQWFRHLPD